MPVEVIAIFDIGKTNKKLLLFDDSLNLVYQQDQAITELTDEDGFECDDVRSIGTWMKEKVSGLIHDDQYILRGLNFTTYGASLMHLDAAGQELTPVYNYLKPMPGDVLKGFYEKYGGVEEFSRKTASPALDMLNSGLQILWLKKKRPELYRQIRHILHFPQYVSYLFTKKIVSEYTSIGCHTALWDFDNHRYHSWMKDENIILPDPVSNSLVFDVAYHGRSFKTGIGIHDSSSSLVPYFKGNAGEFILISTGTWCIFMNPFNTEPLTAEQLRKDSLCYMSVNQQQVKSSRLFMGHLHDMNLERIREHFHAGADAYKQINPDDDICSRLMNSGSRIFFSQGIPPDYIDGKVNYNVFSTFAEAYHQLVFDLVDLCMESLRLILPTPDKANTVYVSGGFARSGLFIRLLKEMLPGKTIYTSEIDNATALGAAMVIYEPVFNRVLPEVNL